MGDAAVSEGRRGGGGGVALGIGSIHRDDGSRAMDSSTTRRRRRRGERRRRRIAARTRGARDAPWSPTAYIVSRSMSAASRMSYRSDAFPFSRSSVGAAEATSFSCSASDDAISREGTTNAAFVRSRRLRSVRARSGAVAEARGSARSRVRSHPRPPACALDTAALAAGICRRLRALLRATDARRWRHRRETKSGAIPNPSVHLARASDRGDVGKMFGWYRRAFIDTGSSAPLTHVMVRLASSSRPRAPRASRSFARSIFSRYP